MSRRLRDYRLDSPDARSKLSKRDAPYYRGIIPGLAIGYRKGAKGGSWSGRKRMGKVYEKWPIGIADDIVDADGIEVLSFAQADEKARLGPSGSIDKKMSTVSDAMNYYMKHQESEAQNAKSTQYVIDRYIEATMGSLKLSSLTTDSIKNWRNSLTAPRKFPNKTPLDSPREQLRKRKASANRILTIFKAAMNYAVEEGKYRGYAPWKSVKPFKNVEATDQPYLTRDEAIRLQNACPPDFRLLVRGALETGCRYGELASMKATDFNSDAGTVRIRESKSGKVRHAHLTNSGREFFDELVADKKRTGLIFPKRNGKPWGKSHQGKPMREACAGANIIPRVPFKALRTTYGSLLAMEGVPLQVIASALGHADTRITERHYSHLLPSYVADTIRAKLPTFSNEKSKVRRLKQA